MQITTRALNSISTAIYVNGKWFDTVHPCKVDLVVRKLRKYGPNSVTYLAATGSDT